MPDQYEAIRDEMMKKGMSKDDAQMHAAKIYNARHPDNPVTSHTHHGMKVKVSGVPRKIKR